MFQYVTCLMKQGYQEESNRQRQLAVSPKERPDKRNTALWDASWSAPNSDCFYLFNTEMCLYILYLRAPFLCHTLCLLLHHKGQKHPPNVQWLLREHFISELKSCRRTWGAGREETNGGQNMKVAENLPCNRDQQQQHLSLSLCVFRPPISKLELYQFWATQLWF